MMRCVLCLVILVATIIYCKAQTQETMADDSFGIKGNVIISDANRSPDTAFLIGARIALQGGKIIVAGGIEREGLHTKFPDRIKILRLNSNGSLDSSFGDKGVFNYTFPEKWNEGILRVQCQSTGKIICLVNGYNGSFSNYKNYHGLVRINANGTLDSAFGNNGFYATGNGLKDMVILPNDEIVVASIRSINGKRGYKIVKYAKDGGMVTSDSIELKAPAYVPEYSSVLLRVTDDNKIVLGGDQYFRGPSQLGFTVFRYDFSLKRDLTYGTNGYFTYVISKDNMRGLSYGFVGMTTQSDGKVVGACLCLDTLKMIGVDGTGKLNKGFGVNGINNYNFKIKLWYIAVYTGLATQSDDKILVAPALNARGLYLTRFNPDGYIDSSFGDSGVSFKHIFVRGHQSYVLPFQLLVQPDNKILVNSDGQFREFSDNDFETATLISRYLPEKISNKTIAKSAITSPLKSAAASISVSPNPVKDILTIFSSNLSYKNISIVNASGVAVLKDAFAGKQHSINVSGLSSGIYYVTVVNNEEITSLKIIKQ